MVKEQKKIEKELADFQKNLYGDQAKKDSLDSIAKLDPKMTKEKVKKAKTSRRSSSSSEKVKKAKTPRSSSSGGGAARVTVRRERH